MASRCAKCNILYGDPTATCFQCKGPTCGGGRPERPVLVERGGERLEMAVRWVGKRWLIVPCFLKLKPLEVHVAGKGSGAIGYSFAPDLFVPKICRRRDKVDECLRDTIAGRVKHLMFRQRGFETMSYCVGRYLDLSEVDGECFALMCSPAHPRLIVETAIPVNQRVLETFDLADAAAVDVEKAFSIETYRWFAGLVGAIRASGELFAAADDDHKPSAGLALLSTLAAEYPLCAALAPEMAPYASWSFHPDESSHATVYVQNPATTFGIPLAPIADTKPASPDVEGLYRPVPGIAWLRYYDGSADPAVHDLRRAQFAQKRLAEKESAPAYTA